MKTYEIMFSTDHPPITVHADGWYVDETFMGFYVEDEDKRKSVASFTQLVYFREISPSHS